MAEAPKLPWKDLWFAVIAICALRQTRAEQRQGVYFLPEFALSPQGSFLEDTTEEQFLTYRYDDQTSRSTQSDEETGGGWDAWGAWSDCSRTCGSGASYSLRRCLNGRNCEGRNIRYKTCSNTDCPADSGDFRAQQCSAYNDVKYQGRFYEWTPAVEDSSSPCALKCQAVGTPLVVELAPKVLDGTRCNAKSLDMCISGICQAVGCDRQLGSQSREDNCGVCAGDGSTCRLVRGQAKTHLSSDEREETVIAVPHGSHSTRITVKGPAHLVIESKTLQGDTGEHSFSAPGIFTIENTTVEFQKGLERESIRIPGPLGADFIIKSRSTGPKDSVVQFFFYQPISHQWRQTEFFPCTVTCGGGYQLNSAECLDIRSKRVVTDQYCHYYPENKKPKPKLKECSMDPCPSSDGFKEIMPYDHFQPLPRWEHNPWTACSVSCGGGIQRRTFVCVEETMQGEVLQVEEWKCMYAPKPRIMQACNLYNCPKWVALEWSQCTVTCGKGLRYRVVLCIDHHGQHTGGCNAHLKPHIKEECLVQIPCYKPKEKSPTEAKIPWFKQPHEMEETRTVSEEPTFIPEPWSTCSASCGHGTQVRDVKCRIYLTFTQTEVELPDDECEGPKPLAERSCHLEPCDTGAALSMPPFSHPEDAGDVLYDWEYIGFTPCSATCFGGTQDAIAVCLHEETRQTVNDSLCDSSKRPPAMTRVCSTSLCPPRWHVGAWRRCSATCGVGVQAREVHCQQLGGSVVGSEKCKEKKPHSLQACNQINCPPVWHLEEWQQCSQTCGGGTQNRKVTCRQLLTGGSFRKLPKEKCPELRPPTSKPCARTDCPPRLVVGEWSRCSVSCGVGTQRREATCQKLTSKGRHLALNGSQCSSFPAPPLERPCHINACKKPKEEKKPKYLGKSASHGPQILGIHRVFIQTRQEKRVNFTVGSRAYLLPKTSVIIKCPVRRFQKSLIRWVKDGQLLHVSKRLDVTKSGSLKISNLDASDIGVYQCIAGSAQETFVLKLIGASNRLLEPPTTRKSGGESRSAEHNEADSFGAKWHKMWQWWNQKSQQYLHDRQVNDQPFLQRLKMQRREPADGFSSREVTAKRLEAVDLPSAFTMDTAHLEELMKNLSLLIETGEISRELASQLVYQLMAKLIRPSPPPLEKQRETHSEKLPAEKLGKSQGVPDNLSTKAQVNSVMGTQKGAVIVRQKAGPEVYSNATVTLPIGGTIFLTKNVSTVHLLCETAEVNNPKYTWTKDGLPLKPFEKVIVEAVGRVQILNPAKNDMGVYCCSIENGFVSDMECSALLYAEAPTILSSVQNITSFERQNLSVAAGGTILARRGTNILMLCPVKGIPQPEVLWFKNERSQRPAFPIANSSSFFLGNVSDREAGIYTCSATNVLGHTMAVTVLRMAGQRFHDPNNRTSSSSKGKRVLMASGIGTKVTAAAGEILRLGCPAQPGATNATRWFVRNQPIEEMEGFHHRVLFGGRILEFPVASDQFAGLYKCFASSNVKPLSVWVTVKKEEYQWKLGEWSSCSATCGNLGTRFQKILCVNIKEQAVNVSLCQGSQKPVANHQPCNIQDCPASWSTMAWSECTASCGPGFHQRQVICKQVNANLSVFTLPPGACADQERPLEVKPCMGHLCAEWIVHLWGQCTGRCLNHGVAFQHRLIQCQYQNGSVAPDSLCDRKKRPPTRRNCSADHCNVRWQTGPWSPCPVDCGSGTQSRQVSCLHRKNKKLVPDQFCAWRKRPAVWRHCNSPCDDRPTP